MNKALELLHTLNSIIPLGDLVYRVRDVEGLGWNGPQVVVWGDACDQMRRMLAEPESPEIDGEFESPEIVRVLGENWEGIYADGKLLVQSSRLNARSILQALGYKVKTIITNKMVLPEKLSDIYDN
jgi:hypothetical protein